MPVWEAKLEPTSAAARVNSTGHRKVLSCISIQVRPPAAVASRAFIHSDAIKNVHADFEVYADPTPEDSAVAIRVTPHDGSAPYLLPLGVKAAQLLTTTLMRTLIALADL